MHPILIKGNYQVVALTEGAQYDPEDIIAYLVMTKSGARLQYALTLDSARSWMEKLLEEDVVRLSAPPPKAKTKRIRR